MSQEDAPLFVIGVGLCRTGTTSLKLALEMLYQQPCYHFSEIVAHHQDHSKLWIDLYRLVEEDSNSKLPEDVVRYIFKGYAASTDHPACAMYKQLMEVYPNAKLILTVRDAKSWIESVRETVRPKHPVIGAGYNGCLLERCLLSPELQTTVDITMRLALGPEVDLTDDDQMIEAFIRRNTEITRSLPPDRLLVFNVKEGWDPLCRFLDKPIPNRPFPHANDRNRRRSELSRAKDRVRVSGILLFVSVGLVAALGIRWVLLP